MTVGQTPNTVSVGDTTGNTEMGVRGEVPWLFPPLTLQYLPLAKPTQKPDGKGVWEIYFPKYGAEQEKGKDRIWDQQAVTGTRSLISLRTQH